MVKARLSEWITEGFYMVKDQLGPWMVATLVFFLLTMAAGFTVLGFFAIMGIVMFGMHAVALTQLRGGQVTVGDLLGTFRLIGPGLAYFFIWIGIVLASLVLCLIPLLFLAPLWIFVPHLVIDQKLGVVAAMKESARVVKQDYWMFLLTNLVIGFLASIGTYACYVGILVTMPFMFCALAIAYRDCWQIPGAYSFMPATTAGAPATPGPAGVTPSAPG